MCITLLTDFGTQDTFVGVMRGVISSLAPNTRLIDLTHHVPPQDIRAGAFALKTAYAYFPPGTVHLMVVDPGVGSERRPIAAHIGSHTYVCPDNGLLTYILAQETLHEAVVLDNPRYHRTPVSRTFHGRDIFAPVAAHLAMGVPLSDLGTGLKTFITFPLPCPEFQDQHILCHILAVDVFGNVFLDMTEDMAEAGEEFEASVKGQLIAGPTASYSAVPEGQPLALFSSNGHLEIAVRNGNAARQFALHVGDPITLRRKRGNTRGTPSP